jgi:hypothetical protein
MSCFAPRDRCARRVWPSTLRADTGTLATRLLLVKSLGRRLDAQATDAAAPGGSDAGVVGGIEALPFGLLVFVLGATLVANAWAVFG